MAWHVDIGPDEERSDAIRASLVAHNKDAAEAVRVRFEPENLAATTVAAYASDAGELVGGCVGSVVDVWHWLEVDLLWVRSDQRGTGLGRTLLTAVEQQARDRGCRWAKLNTWDFQAPDFYERCGYSVYGRETDFPPGHTNFYMRKDL